MEYIACSSEFGRRTIAARMNKARVRVSGFMVKVGINARMYICLNLDPVLSLIITNNFLIC